MRPIGFSTGAIAYSNFQAAIDILVAENVNCIELSALRLPEVQPLLDAMGALNVERYTYVSFHAPSSFTAEQESKLARELNRIPRNWPIILHPDSIHDFRIWRDFGSQIALENMDLRKTTGRTVEELSAIFELLPEASMCFDIGHAHQCDTSMTQAYRILKRFRDRLRQVHISEVNAASQHDPLSYRAKVAFRQVAWLIPSHVPLIVESRVLEVDIQREIHQVRDAIPEYNPPRSSNETAISDSRFAC